MPKDILINLLDFELNELVIFVYLGWIGRDEDRHEVFWVLFLFFSDFLILFFIYLI